MVDRRVLVSDALRGTDLCLTMLTIQAGEGWRGEVKSGRDVATRARSSSGKADWGQRSLDPPGRGRGTPYPWRCLVAKGERQCAFIVSYMRGGACPT